MQQRIRQEQAARQKLQREQQALQAEIERMRRDLVRLAAQVQALEQRIATAQRRIGRLQQQRAQVLQRLAANRASTVRLLAALQRLRRDPPPPFVTRPDDVLQAVRSALAMGAVLPRMQEQAQRLRNDLQRLAQLEEELRQARRKHEEGLAALRETSSRMQGMLKLKNDLLKQTGQQLATQEQRLARLLKQSKTLEELQATLERQRAEAARQMAEAARRKQAAGQDAGAADRGDEKRAEEHAASGAEGQRKPASPRLAAVPRKLVPTVPFSRRRGRLPWPAQGRRLAAFGERTALLGKARGIYVSTLPGAVVTAPAEGKVLLAGRFRGYGKLVILDVGEGYRILLAGLQETLVRTGEVVRAGEPVGRMGQRPAPSTVVDENVAGSRPILYMELRKGRKLLDPAGWLINTRRQARRN